MVHRARMPHSPPSLRLLTGFLIATTAACTADAPSYSAAAQPIVGGENTSDYPAVAHISVTVGGAGCAGGAVSSGGRWSSSTSRPAC